MKKIFYYLLISAFACNSLYAQTDSAKDISIDDLLGADAKPEKEYAFNAFKSTRVIMGQSMEMLGAGVLDFRILHRFGNVENGFEDFFGLDNARMRMGFDYGITKNLSVGIGRSTLGRELDGFVKYRILHQHTGVKAIPFSLLYIAGMNSRKISTSDVATDRLSYFHQLVIGRKFSNAFTLQLSPTFVHQNYFADTLKKNDKIAIGIGTRYKLSNRMALVLDAYPVVYGGISGVNRMPLSIGVDIETGGHVFQLHFSNAIGMNERAYIGETTQRWEKGQFQFGFNLSRVFTVRKNTSEAW
jgi:Membrane bound beta barrel domain (DUF5777)